MTIIVADKQVAPPLWGVTIICEAGRRNCWTSSRRANCPRRPQAIRGVVGGQNEMFVEAN